MLGEVSPTMSVSRDAATAREPAGGGRRGIFGHASPPALCLFLALHRFWGKEAPPRHREAVCALVCLRVNRPRVGAGANSVTYHLSLVTMNSGQYATADAVIAQAASLSDFQWFASVW
jgi:hypothetical protein